MLKLTQARRTYNNDRMCPWFSTAVLLHYATLHDQYVQIHMSTHNLKTIKFLINLFPENNTRIY